MEEKKNEFLLNETSAKAIPRQTKMHAAEDVGKIGKKNMLHINTSAHRVSYFKRRGCQAMAQWEQRKIQLIVKWRGGAVQRMQKEKFLFLLGK